MLREEIEQVRAIAREVAKEEIAKAVARWAPPAAPAGLKVDLPAKSAKGAGENGGNHQTT